MRIGIDLGGTKIELIAISEAGEIVFRQRVATPQQNYTATLAAIVDLVSKAELQLGVSCTIGIGTPGSVSSLTGRMKNCNSTCLNQQYLQKDVELALGRPIRLANDANCFTLSEAIEGAADNASVVFGVILGTGVGGGLAVNKHLLTGPNSISGEWGHNPLVNTVIPEGLAGRVCYCGRYDCIESFLSGPGLSLTYKQLFEGELDARQIAQYASAGESKAAEILNLYSRQLAAALAQVINIVDPDVIVLGGGVSNMASLYQRVPELWGEYVFNDTVTTALVPARHGDASGVRGAAWLWGSD